MSEEKKFESILRCPITQKGLIALDAQAIEALKDRIAKGEIAQRDGSAFQGTIDGVLKVEADEIYYIIKEGIYCLLAELALVSTSCVNRSEPTTELKNTIATFYNEFGWTAQKGIYQDALDSEDLRPICAKYITDCHEKINQHLPQKGQYLLDIASGPVQYDAYLKYSQNFNYRICADISITALKEAQKKLKNKGLYLLCDITRLPIKNNQVDGIVSLHTIYHVPKEEQLKAFEELHRALKPGGQCVVIYSWGGHSILMKVLLLPIKAFNYLKRKLKTSKAPSLYFHAYNYRWYVQELKKRFNVELYAWRSVNVPFLKFFIHDFLGGSAILSLLLKLENKFPQLMGRIGAYPMFVITKNSPSSVAGDGI